MSQCSLWKGWTQEQWMNAVFCDHCGLPLIEFEHEPGKGSYSCVFCTWENDVTIKFRKMQEQVHHNAISYTEKINQENNEIRAQLNKALEFALFHSKAYDTVKLAYTNTLNENIQLRTSLLEVGKRNQALEKRVAFLEDRLDYASNSIGDESEE